MEKKHSFLWFQEELTCAVRGERDRDKDILPWNAGMQLPSFFGGINLSYF